MISTVLAIDGSRGEGGGQILRSALSLSIATRRPCRVHRIRAGRRRPGLGHQHLAAVRAAAAVCDADVDGDALGAREIVFRPGRPRPGQYRFSVGTAGSATLVLQTVLPALLTAGGPSELVLEGGTHNPWSPPFEFLQKAFLPTIGKMGPRVTATLEAHGFYPAGGGRLRVAVDPVPRLSPLALLDPGGPPSLEATATVSSLPRHIAERELRVLQGTLGIAPEAATVEEVAEPAGPGNVVTVEVRYPAVTEVFTGFGRRGVRAETVAAEVAAEARTYLELGVPVGPHLADQLLLPMALAGGGAFRTGPPTLHARTNLEVIRSFLDLDVCVAETGGGTFTVTIGG